MNKHQLLIGHDAKENLIASLPKSDSIHVGGYEVKVIESNLFPFEIMYDACSISDRSAIKVGSGEHCVGVLVPLLDSLNALREEMFSNMGISQDREGKLVPFINRF